jgi:4-amino-4-deoxy-L-arabinose transferase-like glycosyltransferase
MCSYKDDPQSYLTDDLPDNPGGGEAPDRVGGNGQHDIPEEVAPRIGGSAHAPVVAQAGGRVARAPTSLPLRPSWLARDLLSDVAPKPRTAPAPDPTTPAEEKPQPAPALPEDEVAPPVSSIQPWEPEATTESLAEGSWWERTAPYRGAVVGVVAAAVGGVGEALLFQEETRGTGAALLVVAMALAVIAWSSVRGLPLLWLRPAGQGSVISWRGGVLLRLAGVFGALALWAASLWAYFAHPDEIFGLQGQLWVASMVLLLAACARWYPRPGLGKQADAGPPWTRTEVVILAGILALSFALRVTWLEDIPWQIHGDVYTNWRESLNFVYDPPRISAFTTTYLGLGQPSLWFVVPAQFMKVFGTEQVGIRMAVAVCGSLLVLPVYGIARLSWGRTAAVIAAIAVAVSASMVHMSRLAMPDMATALWWTCAFYFLLRGLRSRHPGDFVWAGLIAGTSQYTHYASRMLPFVLAAFFVYLAIFHFRALRERLGHLALVAVGFLVGSGPINGYFVLHPEMWGSRAGNGFLIPMSLPTTWEGWMYDWNILSEQLRQNILMFSVIPSRDFFYYASMLLPWEGVLLALGAACLLWRWKQPAAFLVLLWGGSLLLLNSVIEVPENPNPNLTHFRPAWAAFYLALALPPALWLVSLRRIGRRAWQVGVALVGVGAACLLASNVYFYLVKYPLMVPAQDSFRTIQGRLYLQTGPSDLVRVVGGGSYDYDREYARWLGPQTPAGAWFNQTRQLPLVGGTSSNQIFAYLPQNPYVPVIRYYYPDGQVVILPTSDGQVGVETYRVSAQQVQARYGVNASFTQEGAERNPIWQGQVSSVGALPDGVAFTYPVTATWSGALYVPMPGEVRAQLEGATNAEVWLPGQASPRGPAVLDMGWVPFVAQAELDKPAQLQLLLQVNTVPATPVDRLQLWPQPPEGGLAVTLGGDGYPHRIDPFVGSALLWPISNYSDILQPGSLDLNEVFSIFNGPGLFGALPMERGAIRWEGDMYADGGQYQMDVYTGEDWQVRLALDGLPIINQCAVAGGNHMVQVTLSQGWHHVQLDVMGGTSNRGVQWLWTRPDGVREVVPPYRFRYTPSVGPGTSFAWPAKPEPIICP